VKNGKSNNDYGPSLFCLTVQKTDGTGEDGIKTQLWLLMFEADMRLSTLLRKN
jgi:hypothetical protein